MDRGAWWATVHGVAKSQTRLSNFIFTFTTLGNIYHVFGIYCVPGIRLCAFSYLISENHTEELET